MFPMIFQVSADKGVGKLVKKKVKVLSFQLKTFSNLCLRNDVLHTLMQTRLSANQSAHTTLVIL